MKTLNEIAEEVGKADSKSRNIKDSKLLKCLGIYGMLAQNEDSDFAFHFVLSGITGLTFEKPIETIHYLYNNISDEIFDKYEIKIIEGE